MIDFISDASFWTPGFLVDSGWLEHAPFAFWLIEAHRPQLLVELGTHKGFSYFAFNQAVKQLGLKSRSFAIDSWQGDKHAGFYGPEVLKEVRLYNEAHFADSSELIESSFEAAVTAFSDSTIDLLHIDGRHYYEDVKQDFENWKQKLSNRGIVIFHDTNVRVSDFGVYRLWDELKDTYPSFEFLHGHGLGIIGYGPDLPARLNQLFAASGDAELSKQIRQVYQRLGSSITSAVEVLKARDELSKAGDARSALEQAQAVLAHSETERNKVAEALQRSQSDREQLLQELWTIKEAAQSNAQTLQTENGRLQLEIGRLEGVRSQLAGELSRAQSGWQETNRLLVSGRDQGRKLRRKVSRLSEEAARMQIELEVTAKDRDNAKGELSNLQIEFRRTLTGESAAWQAKLLGLQSSLSWRVTSPLRWLSSRAPRVGSSLTHVIRVFWWLLTFQAVKRFRFAQDEKLLSTSYLFDQDFYVRRNPDVALAGTDPIRHYLERGAAEGRLPHPLFDGPWYLQQNQDVAESSTNPLLHYLRHGARERRAPHPLFDIEFYGDQLLEPLPEGADALEHFLTSAPAQGSSPHPLFDPVWYLNRNSDVAASGTNALRHYADIGWQEGRSPHPLFDGSYYLFRYPDVAKAGINPLEHYVGRGGREGRNPIWLFDSRYYCRLQPEALDWPSGPLAHYLQSSPGYRIAPHPLFDIDFYSRKADDLRRGVNPLVHYLITEPSNRTASHPLFDFDHYRTQIPDLDIDPLQHYLIEGAARGLNPCELFHSGFYLERYAKEIGEENPLVDYVVRGAACNRNPNPLFDTRFYLEHNPDVARSGKNPLAHYVDAGAYEGRFPNPLFDSSFYLQRYPDVREARVNPLAHYLVGNGAEEERDPGPSFSTSAYYSQHPELRAKRVNPLAHFLQSRATQPPGSSTPDLVTEPPQIRFRSRNLGAVPSCLPAGDHPTIILVSHVSPFPPRAGNEYRIDRLLRWVRDAGYRTILVLSPLPGETVSDEQVRHLASDFSNVVVCNREGTLTFSMAEGEALVASLDGSTSPSYADAHLQVDKSSRSEQLLHTDRTFCPDALVFVTARLAGHLGRCGVIAEYIFLSRLLPHLPRNVLKVIDTIDVFSTKHEKVIQFGVADSLSLTQQEERDRLLCGDLIVAIQSEEHLELSRLAHPKKVITVGVDFPTIASDRPAKSKTILYVASDNPMNVRGLHDFLRFTWMAVLEQVPDAKLVVAGRICQTVRVAYQNVTLLGPVDDIATHYQEAITAINPAFAGTGLKIKTVEALSHYRPIVSWPAGVEGLDPELVSLCYVAQDWYEFRNHLVTILTSGSHQVFSQEQQELVGRRLSPGFVYRDLEEQLRSFFFDTRAAVA